MRELYAVELRPITNPDLLEAKRSVAEWAARPFDEVGADDLQGASEVSTSTGRIVTTVGPAGEWVMRWWFDSDVDPGLLWLVEVAITGPTAADPIVTIRIRIGQNDRVPPVVGPLVYEFRSPAIVRTLLRTLEVEDVGQRVLPVAEPVGASNVGPPVDFLCHSARRLPVVVLSGSPATGQPLVDERDLAKELAGLAHVRVLTSGLAGRDLTAAVGRERSVWYGAARIYWPGFGLNADPYAHRLWMPHRLLDARRLSLVDELRRWLGSLSSARTAPHPALRSISTALAVRSDELPDWVQEYVEAVEAERDDATQAERDSQAELAARELRVAELEDEVQALRASFRDFALATAPGESLAEAAVRVPSSVREAVEWAISDAGDTWLNRSGR